MSDIAAELETAWERTATGYRHRSREWNLQQIQITGRHYSLYRKVDRIWTWVLTSELHTAVDYVTQKSGGMA